MYNTIISALVVIIISSISTFSQNTTLQNSIDEMNYAIPAEEGITTNGISHTENNTVYFNTAKITAKTTPTCTLYVSAPTIETEKTPLITNKEIEEINAKAQAYKEERIRRNNIRNQKTPKNLYDSCLAIYTSLYPTNHKMAKKLAKEMYETVLIHTTPAALADHYNKEETAKNQAYSRATIIETIN